MNIEFPEKEFLDLLVSLMVVPGPSLHEERRRQFIEQWLDKAGVPFEIDAAGNLLICLGEGEPGNAIIFDAHIDVVEEGLCATPLVDNGCIHGLGCGDNLAAAAMLMFLARGLPRQELFRPLQLVFSVGEEGLGNLKGARRLVADRTVPPLLFVSFDLCYENYALDGVGSNRYQADAECSGGHSWNDYGKPNAIEMLTDYFAQLKTGYRKIIKNSRDIVSFNIGQINGGSGINSIARHATTQFEFRSIDPVLLEEIDLLTRATAADTGKSYDAVLNIKNTGQRPAARAIGAQWIERLILDIWAGEDISPIAVSRSTNINITLASRWPSVCVGLCRSFRHHSEDEYVERDSLVVGWRLLLQLTERLAFDASIREGNDLDRYLDSSQRHSPMSLTRRRRESSLPS